MSCEEKVCGKCKYLQTNYNLTRTGRRYAEYTCNNEKGDYYGLSTGYKESCFDYEEKHLEDMECD